MRTNKNILRNNKKNRENNNKNKFNTRKENTFKNREKNTNKISKQKIEEKKNIETETFSDQIEGRNSVLELLESGKEINKIYITKGEKHGSINKIIAIAIENKIIVVEKDKKQMDSMAQTDNYQGVIAIVPPFEYCEIEEILDGIEDPHNLGSIIRTAETAGVHGIIIPKRRAVAVNSTVNKVSSGAAEHMKIARVNNISDTIENLKQAGLWICGTDVNASKYYYNQDLTGAIAIVIGNEGKGVSEKVKKNCDFLVKIPMYGKVNSLNAAVSTGIVVYEAVKQKNIKKNI